MPDETPSSPPPAPAPESAPIAPIPFHIGEEFSTASKKLPPVKILLAGLAIIVTLAVVVSLYQRPHSTAIGTLDDVVAVEIPGQDSVLVAINVSFQNHGEKPYWIRTIKAEVDTASGQFSDDGAPAVDYPRYLQGFPALKAHALAPLQRESKIEPGGETKGTILVAFPVTAAVFANRKALKVIIQPYDQPVPLVLTK